MSKEIIVCKNMDKTFETSRGAVHVIEDVTLNVRTNCWFCLDQDSVGNRR